MNLQSAYCRIVSAIRPLKQAACWRLTPNGCFQYFQIVAARLLHALDTRRRKPIFISATINYFFNQAGLEMG